MQRYNEFHPHHSFPFSLAHCLESHIINCLLCYLSIPVNLSPDPFTLPRARAQGLPAGARQQPDGLLFVKLSIPINYFISGHYYSVSNHHFN